MSRATSGGHCFLQVPKDVSANVGRTSQMMNGNSKTFRLRMKVLYFNVENIFFHTKRDTYIFNFFIKS
jgi:hypothetical protein